MEGKMAGHALWAVNGSYEQRAGNEVDILIDGETGSPMPSAALGIGLNERAEPCHHLLSV